MPNASETILWWSGSKIDWDVILLLTNAYGKLFTSGDSNHLSENNVVNSLFHKWLSSPQLNNIPYAWVNNRITTLIYLRLNSTTHWSMVFIHN